MNIRMFLKSGCSTATRFSAAAWRKRFDFIDFLDATNHRIA